MIKIKTYPLFLSWDEEKKLASPDMKKVHSVKEETRKNVEDLIGADVKKIILGNNGIQISN